MAAAVGQSTAAVPTGPMADVTHKPRQTTSGKLEDHAATAALYVTRHDRANKTGQEFLDKDQKLSSAGAAASLKYANAQDLPSYPSAGLKRTDSAAGAAASLGWANQKSFEHWKPDPSASASAAAMLAKDYKMAPLWQPEQSTNGAKAALLAHRDGGKVEIWQPEANSAWGNSAATQAFKKFGAGGLSPVLDYGYTQLGREGSLQAAAGAFSNGRRRAMSKPESTLKAPTYPDEANSAANALRAATSAHKQRRTEPQPEGGSSPFTNMSREMYTSHPPVAPEVEERNRQDTLHASAVAMAQGMYARQQTQVASSSHAQHGATAAHRRQPSTTSTINDDAPPMRFNNLQEAAHKLAQERLAKLNTEHSKNRDYRDYYSGTDSYKGGSPVPAAPIPSYHKLSMRGRARRRASSDGDLDEDREQSNKIRAQMSIFSSNLTQVDEKKRSKDREALIAAAQRNVTKSLHGMDERVFAETGKVAPSLLSEWEVKAHAAAQAKSEERMQNHGMVHIGGGKFINQSEIDQVAARNVQPVLDEINEKAAAERERQAALKMEQESQARMAAEKKTREKESKDINKKLRQQDKDEEKSRKADEKAVRKEEERKTKEKRKSIKSEVVPVVASIPEPTTADADTTTDPTEPTTSTPLATTEPTTTSDPQTTSRPTPIRTTSLEDQASIRMREARDAALAGTDEAPKSPSSPGSGKVKNWLKTKFASRRASKGSKSSGSTGVSGSKEKGKEREESGFVGGSALTGATASTAAAGNDGSALHQTESSIPESAGVSALDREDGHSGRVSEDDYVSSMSSDGDDDYEEEFQEARDNFDEDLIPAPTFPASKSSSPVRDSKFHEVI